MEIWRLFGRYWWITTHVSLNCDPYFDGDCGSQTFENHIQNVI
jgi:hypothetical protein